MEESKTSVVCATIEYQPYESGSGYLTPAKIEIIKKILDAHLTKEELGIIRDEMVKMLYRRNDITDYCKMVDLTERGSSDENTL